MIPRCRFWCVIALTALAPLRAAEVTAVERGRAIFAEALHVDGRAVVAATGEARVPLPSSFVACAQCHGADARGKTEGGVTVVDIRGETLSKPYVVEVASGRRRPAYDATSFFAAIARGIDSAGRPLDPAMPRYELTASEAADVLVYLQQIAQALAAGVSDRVIRIGFLAGDAGQGSASARRDADILRAFFAAENRRGEIFRRRIELVEIDAGARDGDASVLAIIDGAMASRDTAATRESAHASPVLVLRLAADPATRLRRDEFALYPRAVPVQSDAGASNERVRERALLATAALLVEALKNSGRELTHEKLVASLEAMHDFRTEFAPPLSFGPSRHIAVGEP